MTSSKVDASNPKTSDGVMSRYERKRMRPAIGSDTSADGKLSYLDLDTGRVLSEKKTGNMMLSSTTYDIMMNKLLSFEKGFEKLQKVDTLQCVKSLSVKMQDFEQRVNTN
ncbi:hypothetical protein DPMN_025081 [Dreissena polymorpha]|uniref:Uncharacterized protein n=1 Tax=Dreissena polymorpha TaxID=45954 RepID=A0A9D4LP52_DREPO|nr:hypothetical protein DPMN_025081 [Dreissena polymorpha]